MSSSKKKKQKKRADFQKVKLKVGRKIVKSANETQTSFKSKRIQIREQAFKATHEDHQATNKIKLEDVYHGLRNQNSSVRKDTLTNFKKSVGSNVDLISVSLKDVIQHLAKLVEDKVGDVRKLAMATLKLVLNVIPREKVQPLFPIVSSYLNCAMTHIEPAIQRDSLEFLDHLLEFFPDMLAASHQQLLDNFLQLISHSNESSTDSGKRVLTVNPNKMMTENSWRMLVMKRLQKFLRSLVKLASESKRNAIAPINLVWDDTKQLYASLALVNSLQMFERHLLSHNQAMLNGNSCLNNVLWEGKMFGSFSLSMVSLIFDTWKESAASEEIGKNSNACLSFESLEYLHCLMDIINSILQCLHFCEENTESTIVSFRVSYGTTFRNLFLKHFPYKLKVIHEQQNGKAGLQQSLCIDLNLLIARIYFHLDNGSGNTGSGNYWTRIMEYVNFQKEKLEKKPDSAQLKNVNELVQMLSEKKKLS